MALFFLGMTVGLLFGHLIATSHYTEKEYKATINHIIRIDGKDYALRALWR